MSADQIASLEAELDVLRGQLASQRAEYELRTERLRREDRVRIAQLESQLAGRDERIQELERALERVNREYQQARSMMLGAKGGVGVV